MNSLTPQERQERQHWAKVGLLVVTGLLAMSYFWPPSRGDVPFGAFLGVLWYQMYQRAGGDFRSWFTRGDRGQ